MFTYWTDGNVRTHYTDIPWLGIWNQNNENSNTDKSNIFIPSMFCIYWLRVRKYLKACVECIPLLDNKKKSHTQYLPSQQTFGAWGVSILYSIKQWLFTLHTFVHRRLCICAVIRFAAIYLEPVGSFLPEISAVAKASINVNNNKIINNKIMQEAFIGDEV